ncbi:MAG: biopolymer transport protein TolR [Pseudomonadota bacterium]|jgi:biopolymer transport protein TolR|nr:biopolymer transport protein TolR [Pseudomonadota bacterium]
MNVSNKKAGRRRPMAEINVVPYIDVTLVLLIIFMITTPMLQSGVEVDLPKAQAAMVEQKDDTPPLVISIQQGGNYFINSGDGEDEAISKEAIYPRVEMILKNKPETQVLINADKNVDYGTVVTTMADLKHAGVPSVSLMTKDEN